jgi:hypothetical protein
MNPPPFGVALIASEMTTSVYKGLGVFSELRNVADVLDYSCRYVVAVLDASSLDLFLASHLLLTHHVSIVFRSSYLLTHLLL